MSLRIAVLHGCCQNSEMIENLLKDYIKKVKKTNGDNQVYFIQGQYIHRDRGYMWYRTHLELDRIGSDDIPESDINETLDYIESFIKEKEINCLIGFSQGGNVVSTYLRLRNGDSHITKSIIMAGYDFPRYVNLPIIVSKLILIYSEEDKIVDYKLTESISSEAIKLSHNKGHIIYNRGGFITALIDILHN